MMQVQENASTEGRKDVRTDAREDGQTLFETTLPATARDPMLLS